MIISTVQMRKQRLREGKRLAPNHTAGPGHLASDILLHSEWSKKVSSFWPSCRGLAGAEVDVILVLHQHHSGHVHYWGPTAGEALC